MKRIKKRTLSLLLAIVMLFSVGGVSAAAARVIIRCDNESCTQSGDNSQLYQRLLELLNRYSKGCAKCKPTQAPTQKPTTAPTQKPTQAPAQEPTAAPAQSPTEQQAQQSYQLNENEREVVRLVNKIRVKNGLGELTIDPQLSRVARLKSQDMHDQGYFGHNSPTYGSPFDMMKSFGISYRTAGENIAMGYRSPQSVVDGWMNSAGHRKNILNGSFTKIGMGYVAGGNYWTQMFIG